LINRQRKYCSVKCQRQQWRKDNPDHVKWYNVSEKKKEWKINNPIKFHEQQKKERERTKNERLIRKLTSYKYGKAKKCYECNSMHNVEHHHTTIPYLTDYFVDLCKDCHAKEHKGVRK
jgi:acetone carboxylase gamma subunit